MLLPVFLSGQEKAVYRIAYDCEALYEKTPETYRWNLDIGASTAVFYNPAHRKHSEAFQSMPESDDLAATMNSIRQLGSQYPNRNSLEILIGVPEKGTYTYINRVGFDLLMYEESLPGIDWELTDSTKTVCGYPCHRARATVHGRTWSVWYSTEVPLPYGPYVLGGLPGLILEAADDEGIFHFVSVGLESVRDSSDVDLIGKADAVRCTRKKYLALRKAGAEQTYAEIAADIVGGTGKVVTITDAGGRDITNRKQSEKNYLDLK